MTDGAAGVIVTGFGIFPNFVSWRGREKKHIETV